MNYPQSIEFLYSLRLFGTKLGLENTRELARLFGNPHQKLRFIHVAGTNGKGSTCAMLESIYRTAGVRTGLFTSPHLVSFTERIQVNRVTISEQDVARLTGVMMAALGGADIEQWALKPTFFEFVTVMALLYFTEQNCDLVIWETGMGGRLDSTNIVNPEASIITNIQLDHQQWLGNSVAEIAAEKAGIIKPGVPVITCAAGVALDVIQAVADRLEAPCIIPAADLLERKFGRFELPLLGEHQRSNAAAALATVEVLKPVLPVEDDQILRGFQNVSWPGRLELIQAGGTRFLLDGAHNPDGSRATAAALASQFSGEEITLVLGLFRDKDWQGVCDILVPLARRVFLVPIHSERSANPAQVQAHCRERFPEVQVHAADSVPAAIDSARVFPFVVVAGSLHLVGEAMEALGVRPDVPSDRRLNEWDAEKTAAQTG